MRLNALLILGKTVTKRGSAPFCEGFPRCDGGCVPHKLAKAPSRTDVSRRTGAREGPHNLVIEMSDRQDSFQKGKLHIDFEPAALAGVDDTYFQAFAVLRALLQGAPKEHACAILDAAEDVAEIHVERRLAGGGQDR